MGSTGGLVCRIAVGSIPVMNRANRGKVMAKLKGSDKLCAVSLLSSMDDDPDDANAAANKPPPVPRPPAPRRAAPRPTQVAAHDSSSAAPAPSTPPLKLEVFDVEMAAGGALPPLALSPSEGTGVDALERRIRGKTRASLEAAAAPYLGKRGRLSHLSPRPRVTTPGRTTPGRRLGATPRTPMHSITKPRTRFLCKTRPAAVKTIDLAAWAARRSAV